MTTIVSADTVCVDYAQRMSAGGDQEESLLQSSQSMAESYGKQRTIGLSGE